MVRAKASPSRDLFACVCFLETGNEPRVFLSLAAAPLIPAVVVEEISYEEQPNYLADTRRRKATAEMNPGEAAWQTTLMNRFNRQIRKQPSRHRCRVAIFSPLIAAHTGNFY